MIGKIQFKGWLIMHGTRDEIDHAMSAVVGKGSDEGIDIKHDTWRPYRHPQTAFTPVPVIGSDTLQLNMGLFTGEDTKRLKNATTLRKLRDLDKLLAKGKVTFQKYEEHVARLRAKLHPLIRHTMDFREHVSTPQFYSAAEILANIHRLDLRTCKFKDPEPSAPPMAPKTPVLKGDLLASTPAKPKAQYFPKRTIRTPKPRVERISRRRTSPPPLQAKTPPWAFAPRFGGAFILHGKPATVFQASEALRARCQESAPEVPVQEDGSKRQTGFHPFYTPLGLLPVPGFQALVPPATDASPPEKQMMMKMVTAEDADRLEYAPILDKLQGLNAQAHNPQLDPEDFQAGMDHLRKALPEGLRSTSDFSTQVSSTRVFEAQAFLDALPTLDLRTGAPRRPDDSPGPDNPGPDDNTDNDDGGNSGPACSLYEEWTPAREKARELAERRSRRQMSF